MQDLTITLIQANLLWKDPQANLREFTRLFSEIPPGSDLIILPEMFNTGFVVDPEDVAETMEGMTIQWLAENAARRNVAITGSLIIKENDRYFNRLVWMQSNGNYFCYDKRHLFSLGEEDLRFTKGERRLVIDCKGWSILPLICYDLRFPVWCRNKYSTGNYEYDCLIYIANWPVIRRNAWKSLLIARAIENLSFVIGVNRVGKDDNGKFHAGDSAVIDPMGITISHIKPCQQAFETVTLSCDILAGTRDHLAFGRDWDQFMITGADF